MIGKSDNKGSLFKNTVMLYVLVASNYLLGLITIPYLTRVLGAETYGAVGFAQAISIYIQLVLDFGFLLSATADVARCERDAKEISRVFSAVTAAKMLLCILSGLVIVVLCIAIPEFKAQWDLIILFFAYVAVNGFLPDYVYRGVERMSAITVRAVTVKALFAFCIFLFVTKPEDKLLVPLFYLIGSVLALVAVLVHIDKSLGIRFVRVDMKTVVLALKKSSAFFLSRIATTFYSSLNLVIMGFLYPESVLLGCYTATDKAIVAGKSASSPIADSLYPYMIRTRNYKLLIKLAVIGFFILVLICIPAFIWAEPLCVMVFGEEYASAAPILKLLLPTVPLALIAYLFGFPALSPMGRAKFANQSVVLAAVLQSVLLLLLWFSGVLCVEGICVATVITEAFVALSRLIVFLKNYKYMRNAC